MYVEVSKLMQFLIHVLQKKPETLKFKTFLQFPNSNFFLGLFILTSNFHESKTLMVCIDVKFPWIQKKDLMSKIFSGHAYLIKFN